MERREHKKITFVFVCIIIFACMIFAKAFYVQVINKTRLVNYSKGQIVREATVYPYRGNIYDRNGSPLAINIKTYSIFTIPRDVVQKDRTWKELAKIVPKLKYSDIKERTYKRQKYTWIARKIELSDEQVEKIKNLKGVYFESVPKRFYPNGELLGQTLGFVGIDNTGLSGVEFLFDEDLKGRPIKYKYLRDAKGRAIKFENEESGGKSKDIYLSIDKELQAIAEKALKETVIEHKAFRGGIGVINSDNGEVLAMANYPNFNPNHVDRSRAEFRKLPFISDPFEPGSTFKILTIASALENKIVRPDTNYFCDYGKLLVEGHWISEAEEHKKYEWLSVTDILKYSSNVGTTKIAFDLTFPKLQKTLSDFNIGEKTGIEIPGESRGIFVNKVNISPLALSNISFGQGVATTGIQMLAAYASIVNDGSYIKPTIIKRNGEAFEKKQIISKKTAKELKKMLIKAVEEGTGKNAKIEHFVIAGKTSTAQKHDKNGGYKGHIPGFIGFPLNVSNKFVIYAYIDDPDGAYYGNIVAAPLFKKVAQYILYRNREIEKTKISQKTEKTPPVELKDSVTVGFSSNEKIDSDTVPNLIGLDKISAQVIIDKLQLKAMHKGIGVIKEQFPKSGQPLNKDLILKLRYEPPQYD